MSGPAQSDIVRLLAGASTVEDASHSVLEALAAELDWDAALLWVPTADGALLRCGASWSGDGGAVDRYLRVCARLTFAPGEGLPGRVWQDGRPEWIGDIAATDLPRAAVAAEAGLQAAVAVPVAAPTGGVIELVATRSRARDDLVLQRLQIAAAQLGHYVARVRAEDRLRETEERANEERRRLLKEAVAARASEEAARVRAEAARREAELDRRRMAFLADAGLRMAVSLDYATALEDVARAAVPDLADLCAVTVRVEPVGRVRPLALAHVDPAREAIARELVERYPDASAARMAAVMRTGVPRIEHYDDAQLAALAVDAEHLRLLRELAPRSALTVPIRASGRTLGAIALFADASGREFGDDDLVVATALAARAGLHIENARLYTERSQIADTLQRSLLPAELPAIPGVEVAASYRPAGEHNQVGGDFYDVFASGDGVWTAIIGDVSGKGAAAAAVTALARHTLYATAMREDSPARNLELLNEAMLRRLSVASAFCTVLYARVCPDGGTARVRLASGGHPPPLIVRADGSVQTFELSGTLVGAIDDAHFADRELTLASGELLLFYTDGAVELRRGDLTLGERQLATILRATAGRSAADVVDALADGVHALQDGGARDDVALLALRILPPDA